MFIPVNMTQQNIDHIVRATGMKKVTKMKHLGVVMDSNGEVKYEDNIRPIENAIRQIIRTLSTSTSTPIGRALFSRFLLASKYIHRLHCMSNAEEFTDLQKLITSQVWNRYTILLVVEDRTTVEPILLPQESVSQCFSAVCLYLIHKFSFTHQDSHG